MIEKTERTAMFKAIAAVLKEQISALDKRIAALETRLTPHYEGVWSPTTVYDKGSVVTDRGSCWISHCDSNQVRPGGDYSWQLMVKAGRDGRNAA